MYAQELMKNILEGLTTLFNAIPTAINTIGQADYPAIKAGNAIGGLISAMVGLIGPVVNSAMNMVPSMLDLGDRLVDLTMWNNGPGSVNEAYHTVNVSGNLPLIVGDGAGTYGITYLLRGMVNIGTYTGNTDTSVNFLIAFYSMLSAVLNALGELMLQDLPDMFPWG